VLTVCDNGVGITSGQVKDPRSIGLVGMRERAQAYGGTLEISGQPGIGTTVTMRIPLHPSPPPTA
jgi:signal transduction histidine kinase